MVIHTIDCDMGVDCTCEAGELECDAVYVKAGMYVLAIPTLIYEHLTALGIDLPPLDVQEPPHHPELGHIEL